MIRPLPIKFGVGFVSNEKLPEEEAAGYRYEQVGIYHNYHATYERWTWPDKIQKTPERFVIDGFSPNLNKNLHVGHLRNLAIANSLSKILASFNAKFVTMLGASLGVKKYALDGWNHWTQFLGYHPEEYFDITLPDDVIETHSGIYESSQGSQVWDGPFGEVIVKRTDGKPLYAYHDLVFSAYVGPTHYITGQEQQEHFKMLGFEKKHLAMGLVLGPDNKKLKSRTGDALLAAEMIEMIVLRLNDCDRQDELAWNILAWNFLHVTRGKNLKFDVENWTRPDQGGLYITYTYARVLSAMKTKPHLLVRMYSSQMLLNSTEEDVKLVGFSEQYLFYFQEAVDHLDSAPLANFAFDLARQINQAYEREKIDGGRPSFVRAIGHATCRLEQCMQNLGMFLVDKT